MQKPLRSAPGRPLRTALAVLGVVALSACDRSPTQPAAPERPAPGGPPVAALLCEARPAQGTLVCEPAHAAADVIGGQGINLELASTALAYDTLTLQMTADVTVKNLLPHTMGADSGLYVFYHEGPSGVGGSVTAEGTDGTATFTASGQAYYHYDERLAPMATTAARQWRWTVPRSVTSFTFRVFVATDVLPSIVFEALAGGNRDVYRMALDGGDVVRLTTNAGDDRAPTWAGSKVVFVSYRNGNADLYSISVFGGVETRLTTATSAETAPALSRDATKLAYATGASGTGRVWTSLSDGTGAATATAGAGGGALAVEGAPSWNPTGDLLVFVSTADGSADLWATAPGGTATRLHGTASAEVEPDWSPDGTKVVFVSNHSGDDELYLVDVASGDTTRLTNRAGTDAHPRWLRDGRIVYTSFTGSTPTLRWLDPDAPGVTVAIPTSGMTPIRPTPVR